MKNTKVVYQFRDAANCKFSNEIVLIGEIKTEELKSALAMFGEESDGFDPRKTGRPSMSLEEGSDKYDGDLDHPMHDLCYFELTESPPTVDYTVEQFLDELKKSAIKGSE